MRYALLIVALVISGCTHNVASYPQNDAAIKRQIVQFQYQDSGMGGGPVTVIMSDGEILNGQYTTAEPGISQSSMSATAHSTAMAFGSSGGMAMGHGTTTATGSGMTIGSHGNGMASLMGNKGTSMRCVYSVSNFTGGGAGTCESSKGEVYTIHF